MIVSAARYRLLEHNFNEARTLYHEQMGYSRVQIGGLEAQIAHLEELLDAERAERRDLMQKYHEAVRPQHNTLAPMKPVERSKLAADLAIDDIVEAKGGSALLRRQLQRYVNIERQKSTDEGVIAKRVKEWRDPDADEEAA